MGGRRVTWRLGLAMFAQLAILEEVLRNDHIQHIRDLGAYASDYIRVQVRHERPLAEQNTFDKVDREMEKLDKAIVRELLKELKS